MIADYFFVRKQHLVVHELYSTQGTYTFSKGFNYVAIIALIAGIVPNIPGFLLTIKAISADAMPSWITGLYHYSWFIGFIISAVIYKAFMPTYTIASTEINTSAYVGAD